MWNTTSHVVRMRLGVQTLACSLGVVVSKKPSSQSKSMREWFAKPDPDTGEMGLRFGCSMCGNCCSGTTGVVMFTETEGRAMAALLELDYDTFLEQYAFATSNGYSLKEVPAGEHGLDCVFLDRTTKPGKALCKVYTHRPKQCQTWPFWPEMLTSRDEWIRAKKTCPGLDNGRLYSPDEIRIIRDHEANG